MVVALTRDKMQKALQLRSAAMHHALQYCSALHFASVQRQRDGAQIINKLSPTAPSNPTFLGNHHQTTIRQ